MSLHSRHAQLMAQASAPSFATADLIYHCSTVTHWRKFNFARNWDLISPLPPHALRATQLQNILPWIYYLPALFSGLYAWNRASSWQGRKKKKEKTHFFYTTERMHDTETEHCLSHVISRSWSSTHMLSQCSTWTSWGKGNEFGTDTESTWRYSFLYLSFAP